MSITKKAVSVPSNAVISGPSICTLLAGKLGLTLKQVFEEVEWTNRALRMEVGDLVRIRATDGACWSEITAITGTGADAVVTLVADSYVGGPDPVVRKRLPATSNWPAPPDTVKRGPGGPALTSKET